MMLTLLAMAAATAAGPDFKPADWNRRPTPEQIHAAWPRDALTHGISGEAMLNCRVDVHGVLEDCHATAETPAGEGFGAAAQVLAPQLLFNPATKAGVPVPSRVVIPINFKFQGMPSAVGFTGSTTVIGRPVWAAAPGFADLAAVYPRGAGGSAGYVAFACDLHRNGLLHNCDVVREEPTRKGFADAARRLIGKFRAQLDPESLPKDVPLRANVAIRLIDPASDDYLNRRVGEPRWIAGIDPDHLQTLFPALAAAKGVKTGLGVARCVVAPDGLLTDCSPLSANPDGLGFSEAAVKVAQVMKMSPWTQEGGPVDGARINLPVRFKLAEDAPSAKP